MVTFAIHFEGAHAFFLNRSRSDAGLQPGIVVQTPTVDGHVYKAVARTASGDCTIITDRLTGKFDLVTTGAVIKPCPCRLVFDDSRNVAPTDPTFTPKPPDGTVQATFWLPLPSQQIKSRNCTCPKAAPTEDLFSGNHKHLVKARRFATLQTFIYDSDAFPPGFGGLWGPTASSLDLVISASLPSDARLHDGHAKEAMNACLGRMDNLSLLAKEFKFEACNGDCEAVRLCNNIHVVNVPPRSCAGGTSTIG